MHGKAFSRFERSLRMKYVAVNIVVVMMASLLCISNLKSVHVYNMMDMVKKVTASAIARSRAVLRLHEQPPPKHYLDQPQHYPWYKHRAGSEKQWDFRLFWEKVQRPEPMISFLHKTPLYMVRNGILYGYRQHQETLKVDGRSYRGRVKRYEHLMMAALALVRQGGHPEGVPLHPSLHALVAEPFPFFMVMGDFVSCANKTWPIFTFATFPEEKDKEEEPCIPLAIPTYTRWKKRKSGQEWKALFQRQHADYPWETKMNKAVWRGASTGYIPKYPYWRHLPRAKLVQYSLDYPTLIDAGINEEYSLRNKTEVEEMKLNGFFKDRIEMQEFQKYKAIIDIDGNSWSSRFAELLCMNSVVLKVTPGWVDYFYLEEVQPWVHYLPVYENLTNLVDMVNLVLDPSRARQMQSIIYNANAWCQSKMTPIQMSVDMSWIMASYVEILNKEDARSGLFGKWKEAVTTSFINNRNNISNGIWTEENWVQISSTRRKKNFA